MRLSELVKSAIDNEEVNPSLHRFNQILHVLKSIPKAVPSLICQFNLRCLEFLKSYISRKEMYFMLCLIDHIISNYEPFRKGFATKETFENFRQVAQYNNFSIFSKKNSFLSEKCKEFAYQWRIYPEMELFAHWSKDHLPINPEVKISNGSLESTARTVEEYILLVGDILEEYEAKKKKPKGYDQLIKNARELYTEFTESLDESIFNGEINEKEKAELNELEEDFRTILSIMESQIEPNSFNEKEYKKSKSALPYTSSKIFLREETPKIISEIVLKRSESQSDYSKTETNYESYPVQRESSSRVSPSILKPLADYGILNPVSRKAGPMTYQMLEDD
ncbi:hypothetical protein EHI8A_071130 [Entamoeba histolytica HM-1:IMSS-B]|uniref:Antigen n=6 Tax=Entamoeba histolytica TaxID=5759 RepID=C4LYQ0_ENTH1|nr:hypothetical protein EHI_004370 [Entamoeba histolytica HM-1:IMSS]EMD47336.1 antigen, putative [Entamoeba histolytica KU27]EMH77017.1 hypothetical protein EHI8A_071130 [Entamoeba histolytica HM-1:IMSS-B]EMS16721.1 antigen, putative [Entamoeba histolytica HM-3:IMSS]ENY60917.1 antigen, putative [Entamoeba histolytica HM-1:IMSS-A]BAN38304.1 hypothetical protein [Entamoeba histolytica]|eukprot:XP_652254.1 hypothetical protein EHI_004370 [Entamoeba histolytica HM-1:IMSS]